jgi:acetyl-CoA carboxylase biotin carboxylase subunit
MFSKVLIANRGEIAVRIIRTCRKMNIKTVAIYSSADRDALHTKLADESIYVGEAPPLKSYLSIPAICEAVKKSGADAVHPGYGFLSEFYQFAEAVEDVGATWIGPRPETMRKLESKTYAKRRAHEHGILTIPGSLEPLRDWKSIEPLFKQYGALLIKPDAGGGGKGTRKVDTLEKAEEYFQAASREARLYFGNSAVYAEKILDRPRHIEVQILADLYGNIVHLFERECSLQRRFQKIIEETPSPCISPEQRKKLLKLALETAEAVNYSNAGTFEFLYEQSSGNFYFLEVNKRLQVEHPITEMTTGIDIVEEQLKIASGEYLSIKQQDLEQKGHSIEARIYAEDPKTFIPCPGKITRVKIPEHENIRVDHAIEPETNVSFYYDPLIAKLITWGNTRIEAIGTMKKALSDFVIEGIKTSIPFHRVIFERPEFVEGKFDTTYLDNNLVQLQSSISS